MATKALAAVQVADRKIELREFDLPRISSQDGLLRIEACGICGSDYEQYNGELGGGGFRVPYPLIPGHEPLGIIEDIGEEAAQKWGVQKGDRVAVEPILHCGVCPNCLSGRYLLCRGKKRAWAYAYTSTEVSPALWGGYAQYMYLAPNTVLHKVAPTIPAELAVMFNPLGAGVRWACQIPGTKMGDTVVILGPGQRGLASVIAAREAEAGLIIVTGLKADAKKLALAKEFGAHYTITVEEENTAERVGEITKGDMADVVVDVSAYATQPVLDAIEITKPGGTVVLAGIKGQRPVPNFLSDRIILREITVKGALGVDYPAYEQAIRIIESGKYPLEKMHTHTLPLEQVEHAIKILAREVPGEDAIHIAIKP